jgi:hypothetical protein
MMQDKDCIREVIDNCEGLATISLWGYTPIYGIGAIRQIELIRELIPDWNVLICVSKTFCYPYNLNDVSDACKLYKNAAIVNVESYQDNFPLCIVKSGMFWRFAVSSICGDKPIRSFDADCRLNEREVQYMKLWLQSDKQYFSVRDHPSQKIPNGSILGLRGDKSLFLNRMYKYLHEFGSISEQYGQDESFLSNFFAETSNSWYLYDRCLPSSNTNVYIPRLDRNTFIGMGMTEENKPLHQSTLIDLNRMDPQ